VVDPAPVPAPAGADASAAVVAVDPVPVVVPDAFDVTAGAAVTLTPSTWNTPGVGSVP
jgi:hypothetical protein